MTKVLNTNVFDKDCWELEEAGTRSATSKVLGEPDSLSEDITTSALKVGMIFGKGHVTAGSDLSQNRQKCEFIKV